MQGEDDFGEKEKLSEISYCIHETRTEFYFLKEIFIEQKKFLAK